MDYEDEWGSKELERGDEQMIFPIFTCLWCKVGGFGTSRANRKAELLTQCIGAREGNEDDEYMRPRPDTTDGTLLMLCFLSSLSVANDGMFFHQGSAAVGSVFSNNDGSG
jgi:hypothetical protein